MMEQDKINYDLLMQKEIEELDGRKPKLLMHSCCGPCSTACIDRLKDYFDITIIYYNPNIEPEAEYIKRKQEQIRYLSYVNIPYLDTPYDNDNWHNETLCLKDEPEGGGRCNLCFAIRLHYTAQKAKENNFEYFTTTLTVSPHKNSQIINHIGEKIGEENNIKYLYADFKKREGYKTSITLAKEFDLYRQNYCGCLYSKGDNYEE